MMNKIDVDSDVWGAFTSEVNDLYVRYVINTHKDDTYLTLRQEVLRKYGWTEEQVLDAIRCDPYLGNEWWD